MSPRRPTRLEPQQSRSSKAGLRLEQVALTSSGLPSRQETIRSVTKNEQNGDHSSLFWIEGFWGKAGTTWREVQL